MGLLQLLVHNEAIKVDPPEIYGWRVYALAFSVCQREAFTADMRANKIRRVLAVCCSAWTVGLSVASSPLSHSRSECEMI